MRADVHGRAPGQITPPHEGQFIALRAQAVTPGAMEVVQAFEEGQMIGHASG